MNYILILFAFTLLLINKKKICGFFFSNYEYIVLILLFTFAENTKEIYEFLTKFL